MDNKPLTPMPEPEIIQEADVVPSTMSFPDAMRKIIEGNSVARVSWGNKDYCLLKDGWLTIFRNGKFNTWQVSDGDMIDANDWIVTELPN